MRCAFSEKDVIVKLDEFLETLKLVILNPKDARKIVEENPDLVAESNLKVLRDFVEAMEETGFPRAGLMRKALTLLEIIAEERKTQ